MKNDFPESNTASQVLSKIGNGSADADFARALGVVLDRVQATQKSGKVVLTLEVKPRDDLGVIEMRASVEAKIPKLPPPTTQMHVGPGNSLMDQREWMMGGGPSEAKPKPIPTSNSTASGRMSAVAKAPAPAPVASAPPLAPIATGKDAAAGKDN